MSYFENSIESFLNASRLCRNRTLLDEENGLPIVQVFCAGVSEPAKVGLLDFVEIWTRYPDRTWSSFRGGEHVGLRAIPPDGSKVRVLYIGRIICDLRMKEVESDGGPKARAKGWRTNYLDGNPFNCLRNNLEIVSGEGCNQGFMTSWCNSSRTKDLADGRNPEECARAARARYLDGLNNRKNSGENL